MCKLQKTMKNKEPKTYWCLFPLLLGMVAFGAQKTHAASSSRIASHSLSGFLPTILDILLFLGVLFCFFSSLKVKSFLKDGELAYGWVLFSFSFAILSIAQLFSISVSSGLFEIPLMLVSFIRFLSILSLALGIYFIKKVLS